MNLKALPKTQKVNLAFFKNFFVKQILSIKKVYFAGPYPSMYLKLLKLGFPAKIVVCDKYLQLTFMKKSVFTEKII